MPILGMENEIMLRKAVIMHSIKGLFDKPKVKNLPEFDYEIEWRLFKCKLTPASPEVIVYDSDGIITSGQSNYCFTSITDLKWVREWVGNLPENKKESIKNILDKWGFDSKNIPESLIVNKILLSPIPRLKNPSAVNRMDWKAFLKEVISPNAEKDSRLELVYKATLLRGTKQRYNPHTLLCTNTDVGKTLFYYMVGKRLDKTTKNSLIGFATPSEGKQYGAIHNLDLPFCIEQIESQTSPDILGFLLSFMELGIAESHTGGQSLTCIGNCPMIISANPTGYHTDKIVTFKALIDHLTGNLLALGRRFGIIVYGMDYQKVITKGTLDEIEWRENVQKFRSIEDYIRPIIKELFENEEIQRWLEEPIAGYLEKVRDLIQDIKDEDVKDFLTEHAESGYRHIKGTALNCAIIDLFPKFVKRKIEKKQIDTFETMTKAEAYLAKILVINLESIANMSSLEEKILHIIFKQLPEYLKDLVLAVNEYRKEKGNVKVSLKDLSAYYQGVYYKYWSHITNIINQTSPSTIRRYNRILEKYWLFRLVQMEEGIYTVEFLDSLS